MQEIFDLNNYKKQLIDKYVYEIDNNEVAKTKRTEYLKQHYSDEFLQTLIHDTQDFIITLIENNLSNHVGYAEIDLLKDAEFMFLNLIGGWFSDTFFTVECESGEKIISLHLLKQFLGTSFRIEDDYRGEDAVDEDDDFAIYNTYYYPFIRIIGNFSTLKNKYEELRKTKQNELVLTLKRKLDDGRL